MDFREKHQRRTSNNYHADNAKMITIAFLILSMIIFTAMGDELIKPVIWYWAAGMISMVIICAILDVRAHKKNKEEGLL